MQNSDVQQSTASATVLSAEDVKQRRKESRQKFLDKIRDQLGSVTQQMAFTVPQAGVTCGKSPSWAYRRIYDGTFRVTNEGGRLMIPASEISHFLAGAQKYNPAPKHPKNGGEENGPSQK